MMIAKNGALEIGIQIGQSIRRENGNSKWLGCFLLAFDMK